MKSTTPGTQEKHLAKRRNKKKIEIMKTKHLGSYKCSSFKVVSSHQSSCQNCMLLPSLNANSIYPEKHLHPTLIHLQVQASSSSATRNKLRNIFFRAMDSNHASCHKCNLLPPPTTKMISLEKPPILLWTLLLLNFKY